MALTPAELKKQIRFFLSDLRAQNGQHDFEHLSRNLAGLRFVPNLLPATGPVGAGGDQGRDFESYWTAIDHPVTADARFWKNASGATRVVGTCSLQVAVDRKIRSDIVKLVRGGDVDVVLYFCEANVPVGRRHRHQAWAKERGVVLEIVDGDAIAEMLCERDTFWIAQTYLRMSAEVMPTEVAGDDWYDELRTKYRSRVPFSASISDFLEVKRGLRRATFQEAYRPDLGMWLGRMATFLSSDAPRDLLRSATYETVVASYRGKGDMTDQVVGLRDFFSDVHEFLGLADLQDAVSLAVYGFGAFALGKLALEPQEMIEWRDRLRMLLDEQIELAPGPNRRTGLLHARARLGVLSIGEPGSIVGQEAFVVWHRMLDEARDARLFPIEQFADFLVDVIASGGNNDRYLELAARADELVAERSGRGTLGDKAMARADALWTNGEVLQALAQMHIVKHAWFTGDRLPAAIDCLTSMAKIYRGLGLAYAAKNYALAAAFMASHAERPEIKKLLPPALFEAVESEFAAGNLFGLAQLLLTTLAAHVVLDDDPMDFEKHPQLAAAISRLSGMTGFASRHAPATENSIAQAIAVWPANVRSIVWDMARDAEAFWNEEGAMDAYQTIASALVDRPFADMGVERRIVWRCLGIRWEVVFENAYVPTTKAEEFVAQLQLASCTLASEDLALLPLDVVIVIDTADELDRPGWEEIDPPGETLGWRLTLPTRPSATEVDTTNLTAIVTLFQLCSALSDDMFKDVMAAKARALMEQMHVGRPYPELFREFMPEALFQGDIRRAAPEVGGEFPFHHGEAEELGWRSGPGPTYSDAEARANIEIKYGSVRSVRFTIARLMAAPATRELLIGMRRKGLKDWSILAIVANIALNQRHPISDEDDIDERLAAMQSGLIQDETAEMAIDPGMVTPQLLRAYEKVYVAAHADAWRLAPMSRASATEALSRFMVARYRMLEDDIPHENFFGWQPDESPPSETSGETAT